MDQKHQSLIEKTEEPTKFMLVGLSGVFVNFIILFIAAHVFEFSDKFSLFLAIYISMTTNYILNRIWTFVSTASILFEYIKYILSNSIGMILQFYIALISKILILKIEFIVLNEFIHQSSLFIGSAIGIAIAFMFNYIFSKMFVFKSN